MFVFVQTDSVSCCTMKEPETHFEANGVENDGKTHKSVNA